MESPRANKRQKRRPVACERCHSQKIKCSLELPCTGCIGAKKQDECRFPFRDRNVTVTESYLERLENEVQELKSQIASEPSSTPQPPREHTSSVHPLDPDVANPLLEIPDGLFAGQRSSQPVYVGEASCTAFGDRLLQCVNRRYSTISCNTMTDHVTHPAFNRLLSKDFQLPNRIQAHLLVRRAQSFIGQNYHLLEKKSFFEKLDKEYSQGEPPDLLFVCHLFAVLALGELYSNCKTTSADNRVPGTSWFIQAVSLLQDLYEIASIEQVQILLLLSFYSNALGRIRSGHAYCGIALRLAIGLGLHRSQSGTSTMDPVQRETRRRVWWTLYLFDRMHTSKLGYPLGIEDKDIDVEMPSMVGLSDSQQAEFGDPSHLCAHAGLSRITGDIMSEIYCLPEHNKISFVRRVHRVLSALRKWEDELPVALHFRSDSSARTLYTLHMQKYLCIIQTTRPILLHIFKSRFDSDNNAQKRQQFSQTTLALADACVQAARTTNQLLSKLFVEGTLAVFGYFDAHYLFSSTLILIISAVMEPATSVSDSVQTAFSLLRAMANNGNISANDYLIRLEHIRTTVSTVRAESERHNPTLNINMNVNLSFTGQVDPGHNAFATGQFGDWNTLGSMLAGDGIDAGDPLENPFIDAFLSEKAFQWPDGPSPVQDVHRQFAYELGDDILFGN